MATSKVVSDSDGFIALRNYQFAAYKKTDEYRRALTEIAEKSRDGRGLSADESEEFLRDLDADGYVSMIFEGPQRWKM